MGLWEERCGSTARHRQPAACLSRGEERRRLCAGAVHGAGTVGRSGRLGRAAGGGAQAAAARLVRPGARQAPEEEAGRTGALSEPSTDARPRTPFVAAPESLAV